MTELINQLQAWAWAGNTVWAYLLAAAYFVGILLVLKLVQYLIVKRLKKLAEMTANDFDDVLIEIFSKLRPPFYALVALYFAVSSLQFVGWAETAIRAVFLIVVVYEVIGGLGRLTDYFLRKRFAGSEEGSADVEQGKTATNAIRLLVQIFLWAFGLVLILSNLGVNVTSLVASLGIGGIAVALAVQNVLGDVLSSFTIFSDRPFSIGDAVHVGDDIGVVEQVGLKSTRIRTLQGELLVIPNKEMASTRIRNYKNMKRRRVVINLGIEYGTPAAKLKKAKELVKQAIDRAGATFDRCHFFDYGDSSLVFEVVYYVESSDYTAYMDTREQINLDIYETFEKEGLAFAFPTQTVHLFNEK